MKRLCILFTLLMFTRAQAETLQHQLTLSSGIMDRTPEVTVLLPDSYADSKTNHYPVIYLLDGGANMQMVHSMLQRMHLSGGAKEHIIVALTSQNRLLDFAPTVNRDPRGPVGQGGGADKFLDFVEKELMPHINNTYRSTEYSVIAGHSVGGLLVLHSFHARPGLFQAHLAFSPAVWWGERETVAATQDFLQAREPISGYLYMNIGSESGDMRNVYDALAQFILRNRPVDLFLRQDEFDYEGHDFTMAAGLYNALSGLYKYQQRTDS